jgi:hypothetical protein
MEVFNVLHLVENKLMQIANDVNKHLLLILVGYGSGYFKQMNVSVA